MSELGQVLQNCEHWYAQSQESLYL